jgi:hypothetical protein
MLKTRPDDYSITHLKLDGLDIYTGENDGRIWDNAIKSTVVQVPPPSERYIAIFHRGIFKPRQWVVIGLNGGTEQYDAEIKYVDGSVLVFRHPLPIGKVPKPGDIVCLLRGWKRSFVDARSMDRKTEVIKA